MTKEGKKIGRMISVIASVALLLFLLYAMPIRGEEGIYDAVIRLHVLADSDSDEDQQMKLYVRDRILTECASELLAESDNAEAAVRLLSEDMSGVEACAENAVADFCRDNGIENIPPVECRIGREHYTYREYESLCFPEGDYYSLRIIIGEGRGENWWCVLFPPLCLGAVSKPSEDNSEKEEFISVGITGEQYKIISEGDEPKYRIRFRILEIIESWLG